MADMRDMPEVLAEAVVVLDTPADVGPRDREEQVALDGAVSAIAR